MHGVLIQAADFQVHVEPLRPGTTPRVVPLMLGRARAHSSAGAAPDKFDEIRSVPPHRPA